MECCICLCFVFAIIIYFILTSVGWHSFLGERLAQFCFALEVSMLSLLEFFFLNSKKSFYVVTCYLPPPPKKAHPFSCLWNCFNFTYLILTRACIVYAYEVHFTTNLIIPYVLIQIKIPYGRQTEFSIISADGVDYNLKPAENTLWVPNEASVCFSY